MALRVKPDLIGGYHLLINGLVAELIAAITGAKSLYFCGGGPKEVIGGGYRAGPVFSKLHRPDPVIERQLMRAVDGFDCVITRGPKTMQFFCEHGVTTRFECLGGIDSQPLRYAGEEKLYDVILVARLYSSKRVDVFIETIAALKGSRPNLKAVIVGSGELEQAMRALAQRLRLGCALEFAGHQTDVSWWLKRSRVFVLTSENEGLSMALVEAMMAGLPAVVPDVGELSGLVRDGVNGYVVRDPQPQIFASRIQLLLESEDLWTRFSQAAIIATNKSTLEETAHQWGTLIDEMLSVPTTAVESRRGKTVTA
jgi:glycosyltransferase involved in cell wall biosynthesis